MRFSKNMFKNTFNKATYIANNSTELDLYIVSVKSNAFSMFKSIEIHAT